MLINSRFLFQTTFTRTTRHSIMMRPWLLRAQQATGTRRLSYNHTPRIQLSGTRTLTTAHSHHHPQQQHPVHAAPPPTRNLVKGRWEPIIGLEIHAQIKSKTKLFSDGQTSFNAPTNTHVTLIDAAYPGTLPVTSLLISFCFFFRFHPLIDHTPSH